MRTGPGDCLFPAERTDPSHPPGQYVADPARIPRRVALRYGGEAWLVTGYHDAREVLANSGCSSDSTRQGYPLFPLAAHKRIPGHFISMDPPEHTRLRRTVAAMFMPPALRSIEPYISGLAHQLVASGRDRTGGFDLVAHIATPLHGGVIAELLGVPAEDQRLFQECTRQLQQHDSSVVSRTAAAGRLGRYLAGLLAAPDALRPGTMLHTLGRSLTAREITQSEAVAVASLSIVAGLETTVGLLALTVLALLKDRRQWELVTQSHEWWAGAAVDEGLRYWSVVQHGVARVATRDMMLSGQRIAAGDAVVVHVPTANRDPRVYADADSFDIKRSTRTNLGFGHGPHYCLGASLARMEMTAAISELATIMPDLRLDRSESELSYLHHMLIYGVEELPLVARAPDEPGGQN